MSKECQRSVAILPEKNAVQQSNDPAKADQEAFLDAVGDVQPLKDSPLPLAKIKDESPGVAARRAAAIATGPAADPNYLHFKDVRPVAPLEVVEYYKDGVQHGVRKKLRHGEYEVQDTLDLHRKFLNEARVEVFHFMQRCIARGLRLVLISHGKGAQSETPGRMKSHVVHWLKQVPEVIAFYSALPRHGGTGAVYVLIRKSEDERIENRERHGHKGRLEHT